MEKKLYVIPSLEVVEMKCVSILAGSPQKVDVKISNEEIENGFTQDTKKHDGFTNHTWE